MDEQKLTPRTIVQIAVSGTENNADVVYALADDGTLWCLYNTKDPAWESLPPLPARRRSRPASQCAD